MNSSSYPSLIEAGNIPVFIFPFSFSNLNLICFYLLLPYTSENSNVLFCFLRHNENTARRETSFFLDPDCFCNEANWQFLRPCDYFTLANLNGLVTIFKIYTICEDLRAFVVCESQQMHNPWFIES